MLKAATTVPTMPQPLLKKKTVILIGTSWRQKNPRENSRKRERENVEEKTCKLTTLNQYVTKQYLWPDVTFSSACFRAFAAKRQRRDIKVLDWKISDPPTT